MTPPWFKRKGYGHFDVPVGEDFTSKLSESFVQSHSWSPLIRYNKRTKRYKPKLHVTEFKDRPIMYASHRDACILSKYAFRLNAALEDYYTIVGLAKHVIAYRALGKSNYDFAGDARDFVVAKGNCLALCFDVSGFFDHLDHKQLKSRLKFVLGLKELPNDWYLVFREVTRHKWVQRDDLKADPVFGPRLKKPAGRPIATIAELKKSKVTISENPNPFGIPQGTPISAVFANLYMIEFDQKIAAVCASIGALYQRYSDDILVICDEKDQALVISEVQTALLNQKLKLSHGKTESVVIKPGGEDPFQYLGFYISYSNVYLRSSSIGRQWRKLRRAIRRIERVGRQAILNGSADKIYTKSLRSKFSPIGAQNFSSYARRAAQALQAEKIKKQIRRFERAADRAIRGLNK